MDMNQILATYAAPVTQCAFMFAFGACVGSLTNVLVYRLPRGLDVVSPPSRCPACDTRLTWRENIPVFGWLALGGRCRFCKSRISPEYPLVEAFVGVLFVAMFLLWYVIKPGSEWLGVDWGLVKPEWASAGFGQTWPAFVTLLILISCLVAMTLVDAKTFTIPMVLTTVPAIVGVVAHPAHALWIQRSTPGYLYRHADHEVWTIATFGHTGWQALGAALGGAAGIGVSLILLRLKILTRSFADYDQWELRVRAEAASSAAVPPIEPPGASGPGAAIESPTPSGTGVPVLSPTDAPDHASDTARTSDGPPPRASDPEAPVGPRHEPSRAFRRTVLIYTAFTLGLALVGAVVAPVLGAVALLGAVAGALVGPIAAGIVTARPATGQAPPRDSDKPDSPSDPDSDSVVGDPEMWLAYPHARREMVRELAFVCPAIVLAMIGAVVFRTLGGPWTPDPATGEMLPATLLPLWAVALGGSLLGYLIGGAVVWGVRIFGSIAFGKEAMGMGDVHLMAAVGACTGWIDATLAFFLAAFVGLYWVIAAAARSGGRVDRAMPYGPYLAAATMIVIVAKPVVEALLSRILGGTPVDLP